MTKPPRVFLLRAPSGEAAAGRLTSLLDRELGLRCEPFNLKTVKALPNPGSAWFVALLSPDLKGLSQEVNWVMNHHPDRALPVTARPCNPGDVHPGFDFLTPYEYLTGSDEEAARLVREWKRSGLGRPRAGCSVLIFLSMKGGVAKTTNLTAVAECLATQGNRVLVIDTDHQCGSSAVLLGEEQLDSLERRERTLADLMREALDDDFRPDRVRHYAAPATSIADIGDRLSVVPGSLRLEDFWSYYRPTGKRPFTTGAQANTFLRTTRAGQFKSWLKANYDYALVDCPPAVAWQVRFFMLVADGYVVPTIPDRLSVRGARYLARRVQSLKINIHPVGLLWSMFRKQCGVHCEYVEGIKTGDERLEWEDPNAPPLPQPFATCIPHGNDVIDRSLNPDSQPRSFADKYGAEFGKLFRGLTKEIITRTRAVAPAKAAQLAGA